MNERSFSPEATSGWVALKPVGLKIALYGRLSAPELVEGDCGLRTADCLTVDA